MLRLKNVFTWKNFGLLLLIFLFFNHIRFIEQIQNSVVRADYWRFVNLIELYFQGDLGWAAMAAATNGPFKSLAIPGVFLVDGIFFNLELLGIQYAAALTLFGSSLLVWFLYERWFRDVGRCFTIILITAFLLSLLTPYQTYLYAHGQASLSLMRVSLYLCSFALVDIFLIRSRNSPCLFWLMIMFLFLSIVIYGHSAMPSFVAAIVIIASLQLILSYVSNRSWKKEVVVLVSTVSFFLLHYLTMYESGNLSIDILSLLQAAVAVLMFYCKLVGGSVLGCLGTILSGKVVAIVGALCLLAITVAVIMFFCARLYKKTFFPLLLILYSLLFCAQVTLARFQSMTYPEKAMRYLGDTPVWMAGFILLIVLLAPYLKEMQLAKKPYFFVRVGLNSCVVCVAALILFNIRGQWQRSYSLQRYFERYEKTILLYANDRNSIDGIDENDRIKGFIHSSIDVLISRKLNMFSDDWED